MDDDFSSEHEGAVEYPIDGVLDLHVFPPCDVHDLVPEYLRACREKGILTVRIIHGKGTGTLRRIVHSQLESIAWVRSYHLAGHGSGTWGATIAHLEPYGSSDPDQDHK
jgi:DNA-nicking Smr family endonuclease